VSCSIGHAAAGLEPARSAEILLAVCKRSAAHGSGKQKKSSCPFERTTAYVTNR
jgi:hypothetical protein